MGSPAPGRAAKGRPITRNTEARIVPEAYDRATYPHNHPNVLPPAGGRSFTARDTPHKIGHDLTGDKPPRAERDVRCLARDPAHKDGAPGLDARWLPRWDSTDPTNELAPAGEDRIRAYPNLKED